MIHASYFVLLREIVSKVSIFTRCNVMWICEPVYGTYTDIIKPSSKGTGVNMAPVIDEK
jgi:hypothetical protein